MVFDADALNALATEPEVLAHPGGPRSHAASRRVARLIGRKLEGELRGDAAVQLAARANIVVVLKGHRTLVTDGRRRAINTTGNPGMATGGSGDVLTGLITALLCQHLEPFDAARLGVYLHGLRRRSGRRGIGPGVIGGQRSDPIPAEGVSKYADPTTLETRVV